MASKEGTGGDGGDVVLVQVQVLQLAQLVQRTRWNLQDDCSKNIKIRSFEFALALNHRLLQTKFRTHLPS